MNITSKFPDLGTTIFTTMTKLAVEKKAINLGQGSPNFDGDSFLMERLNYHVRNGQNQYAPMSGVSPLREQISEMHRRIYSIDVHGDQEITVTSGATEAIFCAISSVVNEGDEVILFDPSYDSYSPNIRLNKGLPIHINLNEDFSIPWEEVKQKISSKTKMIILNTPHNPSGKCLEKSDIETLWELIKDQNIFLLCDEVYQHIIFDNRKHLSPFNDERMRDRTFSISSFGKTFHMTGWKIGYCLANKELTKEFRKIHQYITFCTFSPAQLALADMMEKEPNYYEGLASFYQKKRDLLAEGLKKSPLKVLPVEGSYFQLVDYKDVSQKEDSQFCLDLIESHSIVGIPINVFYKTPPKQTLMRLCFAKTDEVIIEALKKLGEEW